MVMVMVMVMVRVRVMVMVMVRTCLGEYFLTSHSILYRDGCQGLGVKG